MSGLFCVVSHSLSEDERPFNKEEDMITRLLQIRSLDTYSKCCILETKGTHTPVKMEHLIRQASWKKGEAPYWPMHPSSIVTGFKNVYCGIETCPGYMPGCYVQAKNLIIIGDYSQISANVGLISSNHDVHDLRKHIPGVGIRIGKYCWLGMNVVVLPNVELGDFTIVGAGSVVTKSFNEGYCIVAGNPAKKIKDLNKEECVIYHRDNPYNGFVKSTLFDEYRRNYLNV